MRISKSRSGGGGGSSDGKGNWVVMRRISKQHKERQDAEYTETEAQGEDE